MEQYNLQNGSYGAKWWIISSGCLADPGVRCLHYDGLCRGDSGGLDIADITKSTAEIRAVDPLARAGEQDLLFQLLDVLSPTPLPSVLPAGPHIIRIFPS